MCVFRFLSIVNYTDTPDTWALLIQEMWLTPRYFYSNMSFFFFAQHWTEGSSIIVFLMLCHPTHALSTPSDLCHARTQTHAHTHTHVGGLDATLSAEHWGVLLLTAVRIKAAVHPLLSDGCGAAGLAFVLRSIMAHYNYSVSRAGSIYLFHPLPHLTSQGSRGEHAANGPLSCVLASDVAVCILLE